MKKLFNIHILISLCSSLLMMTSCELMEFEDVAINAASMHLEKDTLYCMVGDTVRVMPVFTPDTVTVADLYWTTSDEEVATVYDSHIVGVGEGWATFSAVSVSKRMIDSCHVYVMPRWEANDALYPYETVVYAEPKFGDIDFNPNTMLVGAFVGESIRGVGELKEVKGIKYIQIRIANSTDGGDEFAEPIRFKLYERDKLLVTPFTNFLLHDGETHGMLSNLYQLKLKK